MSIRDGKAEKTMLGNLTKAEAVYRETRWRILTGALPPATAVNQAELATEFGVSQTPVREALLRLESEGLVVFIAHSMVRVSPLDLQEFDELYAIRVNLDSFAGRLAASNRTPEDLAHLDALLAQNGALGLDDRLKRNLDFHRSIYRACGNKQLSVLLDQLWDRTERYRIVLVANEADTKQYQRSHSDDEHRAIATALANGDGEKVAALLRQHVQQSHDLIRSMLEDSDSFARIAGRA
jgi:DNA-binding GntR family transcriptional regulator